LSIEASTTIGAMAVDLNNADLDALNTLLARTPPPLEPMDAVVVDGYLAGVSVQPRIVPITDWLPGVFDVEGRALPQDHDPAWLARCRALIERRFEVMNADLADSGWFDPVIVDIDTTPPASEYEEPKTDAARALGPWLFGFQLALERFPELHERADAKVAKALATFDALMALDDAGRAVDDLVTTVAALWAATEPTRYEVPTIRRAVPKVGRNDPCPCGSGRKYKACHGASA
jgi:uncharacterized protein